MRVRRRILALTDRLFDRLRDRRAFAIAERDAVDDDLDSLRGHTYAVLVTFRRTGEAVPSPVWLALDERGTAYLKTVEHAGKVKRIRRDSRVLVGPSTMRGRPLGPAIRATATLVPSDEWPHAERTLAAAHGPVRWTAERLLGDAAPAAYVALRPRR